MLNLFFVVVLLLLFNFLEAIVALLGQGSDQAESLFSITVRSYYFAVEFVDPVCSFFFIDIFKFLDPFFLLILLLLTSEQIVQFT